MTSAIRAIKQGKGGKKYLILTGVEGKSLCGGDI